MGISWKGGASPKALARKFQQKQKLMQRETLGALGKAATELEKSVKHRLFPARKVSQQDAPSHRALTLAGRAPYRLQIQKAERQARITLVRHWTPARTAGVRKVFGRFGLTDKLTRKGLVVKDRKGRNPEYVPFARDKGLAKWATRKEKGNQLFRHVVRLDSPDVIQALQLEPAVKESRSTIQGIFRAAARRGFVG